MVVYEKKLEIYMYKIPIYYPENDTAQLYIVLERDVLP